MAAATKGAWPSLEASETNPLQQDTPGGTPPADPAGGTPPPGDSRGTCSSIGKGELIVGAFGAFFAGALTCFLGHSTSADIAATSWRDGLLFVAGLPVGGCSFTFVPLMFNVESPLFRRSLEGIVLAGFVLGGIAIGLSVWVYDGDVYCGHHGAPGAFCYTGIGLWLLTPPAFIMLCRRNVNVPILRLLMQQFQWNLVVILIMWMMLVRSWGLILVAPSEGWVFHVLYGICGFMPLFSLLLLDCLEDQSKVFRFWFPLTYVSSNGFALFNHAVGGWPTTQLVQFNSSYGSAAPGLSDGGQLTGAFSTILLLMANFIMAALWDPQGNNIAWPVGAKLRKADVPKLTLTKSFGKVIVSFPDHERPASSGIGGAAPVPPSHCECSC